MYDVEEIKRRRKKLGITQKRLAELVGVSQPMIARIESGTVDPKLSLVRKIFRALEEIDGKSITSMDIMTSPVVTVSVDDTLLKAIELMERHNISQLPVIESDIPIGSISEGTVLKLIVEKGLTEAGGILVGDVMSEPFPFITPETTLDRISRLLMEHQALLVIERNKIKGIITKYDLMKALHRGI